MQDYPAGKELIDCYTVWKMNKINELSNAENLVMWLVKKVLQKYYKPNQM